MYRYLLMGLLISLVIGPRIGTASDTTAPTGDHLRVFTEEFPPFNYTRDGELQGASAEILKAVLERAEIPYALEVYPWARSYQLATRTPNALIFSISRRKSREELFKWIGNLTPPVAYSVFTLRHRHEIRIDALADMKGYQVGTSVNDARESYLLKHGFEVSDLQRVSGKDAHEVNYRKLTSGRIDLWPMPEPVMRFTVESLGGDPDTELRKVFELADLSSSGLYVAASNSTPDGTVETLRRELEAFKRTPAYREILDRWGM